ncbi:19248_t:CDS:2 [Funneliformis geosporum]|uniref:19248_t:CDS:1 n=1 Tax=Funneliformis geosporum TaxID=1117311 RepID=A0A9W4SLS2_9GLOM|nr:19248_t:CDS:2 [Funneliformis geosporum]
MSYTIREARIRFGHWIIQYDLGARALSDSFGSGSRYYRKRFKAKRVMFTVLVSYGRYQMVVLLFIVKVDNTTFSLERFRCRRVNTQKENVSLYTNSSNIENVQNDSDKENENVDNIIDQYTNIPNHNDDHHFA